MKQLLDDDGDENNVEEKVKQKDDPYQELLMDPGELLNNIKQIHLSRF